MHTTVVDGLYCSPGCVFHKVSCGDVACYVLSNVLILCHRRRREFTVASDQQVFD